MKKLTEEQMSKVLGGFEPILIEDMPKSGGPIITEDMTGCKKPKPTTCS